MAHGIRGSRIASQCECLAATAAEISLASFTACARLRQERRSAECIESRRRGPDLAQRMIADIPELKARDRLRGMTGQDSAGRRDVKRAATPAADTRLGKTCVIVRQHPV